MATDTTSVGGHVDGYEADPDEVAAIVASLIDDEDRADPTLWYVRATKMQALYTAVIAELRAERAGAVTAMAADLPHRAVADRLGLHYSRVTAMVKSARGQA